MCMVLSRTYVIRARRSRIWLDVVSRFRSAARGSALRSAWQSLRLLKPTEAAIAPTHQALDSALFIEEQLGTRSIDRALQLHGVRWKCLDPLNKEVRD